MSERDLSTVYTNLQTLGIAGFEGEIDSRYADSPSVSWLRQLPARLANQDADLIYRQRNLLFRLDDPLDSADAGVCVKAFRVPPLLRSVYYRSHGSKAARAHAYAKHLYAQGVGVAEPIGYMERWEGKRLVESYLLTRYLADTTDLYSEMSRLLREDPDAARLIDLLRFSASAIRAMHDAGFVHNDLGAQNFLLRRVGEAEWTDPVFIDLNRGRPCAQVNLQLRARDLSRLEIPSHFLKIFYHIYFHEAEIPAEFSRWERRYRARIRRHRATSKLRHPVRTWRMHNQQVTVSSGRPPERDIWLWDEKSGQPSVVLLSRDRAKYRSAMDALRLLWANLRQARRLRSQYRTLKARAYTQPVSMAGRLGVCVEMGENFDAQLALLKATPGLPVFVRCYFHKGEQGLQACIVAMEKLAAAGHEVAVGIVQSRQAVVHIDQWLAFVTEVLQRCQHVASVVEIGHAVNRVKWGFWTLGEMNAIWEGVAELRQTYPHVTFLGPAVNDFEYHYYPPLLDKMAHLVDGVACHLYVDRRGQPENFQGRFSALEKCIYGKAIADVYGKKGFYITETNWPLKNTGEHSPLAGAYCLPGGEESPLHVDEHTCAAYLVRFALIALCSGTTEKLWWWRLAHHGFGLVDELDGFRVRPAWEALVHFHTTLQDETFVRREEKNGAIWWYFERCTLVYALAPTEGVVPNGYKTVRDMCGKVLPLVAGDAMNISGEPLYFHTN